MKFKQIEYALAVSRTLSFSKAAKELYVSQPNISSAINSLEDELGIKIFKRTNQGITITPEGVKFLKHANNILIEFQKIGEITETEPYRKLSVECMFNHTSVSQAFAKLCNEFQNSSNLDFSISTASSREIIDNVYMNKSQLGIALINRTTLDSYLNTMPNKSLEIDVIRSMNVNVNVRKGHPLLEIQPFPFHELHHYPFVNYSFNTLSDFPDIFAMGFVDTDRIINVTERETRGQIVISTDAFSIGCTFHPEMKGIDKIVSIPIPNVEMFLVLIYKKNQPHSEELQRFVELVIEELSKSK
ncbi:LysR family transcriptional regulator [uncultured Clostridium sp.]|uniref:LysR family transcriptional regulator n=1 Tax=uncultured Clostridium sp. TaxID=59620 RepID=UPI0028EE6DCE|nr:LysR family transcriptional regulator [uncultured Clostridium sp.]